MLNQRSIRSDAASCTKFAPETKFHAYSQPCSCETCKAIGREIDDAMMSALGCDVGS